MTKTIIFLLTAAFFFAVSNETKVFATVDIETLVLDKTAVTIPCPPGNKTPESCADDMSVKVSAAAPNAKNGVATFRYTVSGGKIVGEGANVYWDLNGVRAGTYTIIAAAADDGFGFNGRTKTAEITVAECNSCGGDCECPIVSISGSSRIVKKDDVIEFRAIVEGGSQDEVTYSWSVDEYGEIVEGQGTAKIKVKVLERDVVTVVVEIGGLCEICGTIAEFQSTPID